MVPYLFLVNKILNLSFVNKKIKSERILFIMDQFNSRQVSSNPIKVENLNLAKPSMDQPK